VAVAFAWRMRQSTASHTLRGGHTLRRGLQMTWRPGLWASAATERTWTIGPTAKPDTVGPTPGSTARLDRMVMSSPRRCRAPRHQQQADHIASTHQSRYLRCAWAGIPADHGLPSRYRVSSTRFCADLSGLSSAHITANTTAARRRRAVRQAAQRGRVASQRRSSCRCAGDPLRPSAHRRRPYPSQYQNHCDGRCCPTRQSANPSHAASTTVGRSSPRAPSTLFRRSRRRAHRIQVDLSVRTVTSTRSRRL
jgi:hypothetical protein